MLEDRAPTLFFQCYFMPDFGTAKEEKTGKLLEKIDEAGITALNRSSKLT